MLGDRLHDLRFPGQGHKPLVAGRLGVEGVTVAGIGVIQGVVKDAYQVVVFVPGARGLFPVIYLRSSFPSRFPQSGLTFSHRHDATNRKPGASVPG